MAAQTMSRALKAQRKQFAVVGCAHTPEELLKQISEHHPDVAVISAFWMASQRGFKADESCVSLLDYACRRLLDCSDPKQAFEAFSQAPKVLFAGPTRSKPCVNALSVSTPDKSGLTA